MVKQEYIDSAAKMIDTYSDQCQILSAVTQELNFPPMASSFINFRDALSHYKILFESADPVVIVQQHSSIEEHLARGIKDAFVFYCGMLSWRLNGIMISDSCLFKSDDQKNDLRKMIHSFKNLNYRIRFGSDVGMKRDCSNHIDDFAQIYQTTLSLLDKWGKKSELKKRWENQ